MSDDTLTYDIDDDEIVTPDFDTTPPDDTDDILDRPISPARERLLGRRTARKAAPKAAPKAAAKATPTPKQRPGHFVQPLTDLYTGIGALMMPFDQVCGSTIISNAEECAKSLDKLAQENNAVRRALNSLVTTSALGAVIVAHIPIAAMVMAHHGPSKVRNMMSSETTPDDGIGN
jgi:hypothetical protein